MGTPLYLDTARLGTVSPGAERALYSLVRLGRVEGLSARFETLLRAGFGSWPERTRRLYPGLAAWGGVGELKAAVRRLVGLPPGPALLAARTSRLMRLAARLLFERCRRVLLTDLEWPGYVRILEAERPSGAELVRVPLRAAALGGGATAGDLVALLAARYRAGGCDGLFLGAVNHLGVHVPIPTFLRSLGPDRPRFVAIDGAQAFCHLPYDLWECDLYIAGSHKWLGGYLPMGFAVCGRAATEEFVRDGADRILRSGAFDDPLAAFTGELEGGRPVAFSETVGLAALFTARAATADRMVGRPGGEGELFENVETVLEAARGTPWRPVAVHPSLRSGILLLECRDAGTRDSPPARVRQRFHECGLALSCFEGGVIRLSMPRERLHRHAVGRVRKALRRCG